MAESSPKRPAGPRAETMQTDEADVRLTPHFLSDYNRSIDATDATDAAERAKRRGWKKVGEEQVTEDEK